jgi:hypothetical protein
MQCFILDKSEEADARIVANKDRKGTETESEGVMRCAALLQTVYPVPAFSGFHVIEVRVLSNALHSHDNPMLESCKETQRSEWG